MRALDLLSTQHKQHRYRIAEEESAIAPNHLDRQFAVGQRNQVWCGGL